MKYNLLLITTIFITVLAFSLPANSSAYEMKMINNPSVGLQNSIKTVLDKRTHLEWQYKGNKAANWKNANKYCQNLVIGNKRDWRLPAIKELVSIVFYSKKSPAIYEYFTSSTADSEYWSSTQFTDTQSHIWYLNFRFGDLYFADKKMVFFTRCVRDERGYNPVKSKNVLPLTKK